VIPGDVVEISTEVDEVKFLRRLGQWPPIAIQDQPEVLEKLTIKDESEARKPLPIKEKSSVHKQFGLFKSRE
jgi:hypothetical protein